MIKQSPRGPGAGRAGRLRLGGLYGAASALTLALAMAGAAGGVAEAQSAAPAQAGSDSTGAAPTSEVVVTGSRIARRDYVADSPIVTVSSQNLQTQGGATFGVKLQQLPQVTAGSNELVGSGQPTGRATLDLRGLGENRTLVLIDGRRAEPSTADVAVDLNAIPAALIDNVEVITGGASAIYGSDAVAGVVNLKLKHNFQGLELDGQYNVTQLGDGEEKNVDVLFGRNFGDGRGNVTVAFDYLDRGAAYFSDRDFYRKAFTQGAAPWGSTQLPTGNIYFAATNLPTQAALDGVFAGYGVSDAGVSLGGPLSVNSDQTLFAQNGAVNYRGPRTNPYVINPSGALAYNLGTLQLLTAPTTRYSAYGSANYEVTDHVRAYSQFLFTNYDSITNYGAGLQTQYTQAVVPADYAFNPADLNTLLASRSDPTAPYGLDRLWLPTGTSVTEYRNTVYQFVVGFSGDVPGHDITWDVYGSDGQTQIDQIQKSGGASFSRIQELITSRSVPGPNGTLVHVPQYLQAAGGGNALIPNPAYATATNDGGRSFATPDGAIPCPEGLDLFSLAALTPSCSSFLQIHPDDRTQISQQVVEADVQGGLFDLPAGRLKFAAGADYRRNTYDYEPAGDAEDLVGSFPTAATSGATDVAEGYIEALIPVVKDLPLVRSFNIDTAYRYSSYSSSGGVSTYKADGDWQVNSWLRLRGGYARAIRAPNVVELFYPSIPGAATLLAQGDPCNFNSSYRTGPNAAQVRALCVAQGVPASIVDSYETTFNGVPAVSPGNPDLKPEVADSYTAGVVWRSTWDHPLVRKLQLSIDYYDVNVAQAISTLTSDIVFDRCFNADGSNPNYSQSNFYCQQIQRSTINGTPSQVTTPYFNLGALDTSGIDIELNWGVDLADFGLGSGSLDLDAVATNLLTFKVQTTPGAAFQEYAGSTDFFATGDNGSHPRWKANTTLTYSNSGKQIGLRWYFVESMRDNFGGPGTGDYSRFDLFGSWRINSSLQLSAGIDNLFDVEPEITYGGLYGNTDSGTFDPLGRRFYVRFSARLP